MRIRVWYFIGDGGDGSIYPHFYTNQQEAEAARDAQEDDIGGYADGAYGYTDLDVEDYAVTCPHSIEVS